MYKYYKVETSRVVGLSQSNGSTVFTPVPITNVIRIPENEVTGFGINYLHCEVMTRDKENRVVWLETWLNLHHVYNVSVTEEPYTPKVITSNEAT